MKIKTVIASDRDEEVIIYCKKKTALIEQIEQLVANDAFYCIGYLENEAVNLSLNEIYCFTVENNKVYALLEKEKLQIKCRLYKLEETLPEGFIKINQSSIINCAMISRFDASLSGSLLIKLKNGYCDYVSRRNIKNVKERFGI